MDISKLEVGMKVKNYKELCGLLGEDIKGGKSKILQLKNMERYFEYKKEGHAFVILKIHEIEMPKVDKRKDPAKIGNNSKYSKDIQPLILSMLARAKDNSAFMSAGKIMISFSMVNINYAIGRKTINKFSEITNIPVEYALDYFMVNNIQAKRKLETALNGLRNRSLILWHKTISICVRISDEEYNDFGDLKIEVLGGDKPAILRYHKEYREATEEEQRYILKTEKRVMGRLNCFSLQHIFLMGKWHQFQKEVKADLLENANIEYYYDSYKIMFNKEDIENEDINLKRLKPNEKAKITANLNKNMGEMFLNHVNTLHKNAVKKERKTKVDELHATKEYVLLSKGFKETVIDKGAFDIRMELKPSKKTKRNQLNLLVE